ncbi:MAG: murein DD-endopeptidase MepM/ murein hydrolase activator NlpD [Kiritimatiellia bacterium]|jgi:murein DD-endopeptidase MepM/ murein hydrolase activator NlpD
MIDTAMIGLAENARMDASFSKKSDDPVETGKQVERLFAQMLLKEVRKAMPKDGLLASDASAMWQDLFDESLADSIAEGGHLGVGAEVQRLMGYEVAPTVHSFGPYKQGKFEVMGSPTTGRISSGFGDRHHPILHRQQMHYGVDIGTKAGTPIRAMRSGRVTFAGPKGTYGNLVIVDHGDGLQTRYAHARRVDVREGQHVIAGQQLATVGSTGRSTGPHLHFEVRQDGKAIDPTPFLRDR